MDALRGAAALSVVVPHFFLAHQASAVAEFVSIVAVEVFFVLSGFVLAPQVLRCIGGDTSDLLVFYARRWMRTLPIFVLILTAVAIVAGTVGSSDYIKYLVFIRNFQSISDVGDFFAPAWSLAVEEWFYLLFPLYMIAAGRLSLSPLASALVLIVGFFAAKLIVYLVSPELLEASRRIVIWRLDAICFGFLLAIVITRLPNWLPAFAAIAGFAGSVWAKSSNNAFVFMYASSLFACGLLASVRLLLEPALAQYRGLAAVAAFFAATSYTVYLLHVLVLALMGHSAQGATGLLMYLVLLFGGAAAIYRFVELPILSARPSYTQKLPAQKERSLRAGRFHDGRSAST